MKENKEYSALMSEVVSTVQGSSREINLPQDGKGQNLVLSPFSTPSHTEGFSSFCHSEELPLACHSEELSLACHSEELSLACHSEELPLACHSEELSLTSHSEELPLASHSEELSLACHSEELSLACHSEELSLACHSEELSLACHSEELSLACHSEERSDVRIHKNKSGSKKWILKSLCAACCLSAIILFSFGVESYTLYPCDHPVAIKTSSCGTCDERKLVDGWCLPEGCDILTNGGTCLDCNDTAAFADVSKEMCTEACPNRQWNADKGWCELNESSCSDGFKNMYGTCYSCSITSDVPDVDQASCTACPNRLWENGVCKLCDGFIAKGKCYPCDTSGSVYGASAEQCAKCDNRKMNGNYCEIAECNGFTSYGNCYPCDWDVSEVVDTADECNTCSNRYYYYSKVDAQGYCIPRKCSSSEFVAFVEGEYSWSYYPTCVSCNKEEALLADDCGSCSNREFNSDEYLCQLKTCPSGKFRGVWDTYYNKCYDCSTTDKVEASADDCAVCGDKREMSGNYCMLAGACAGFYDNDGTCHECTTPDGVSASAEQCGKCTGREMRNNYCVLTGCNGFVDNNGKCQDCTTTDAFATSETECTKCTNREMKEGFCTPANTEGLTDVYGDWYPCNFDDVILADSCGNCTNRYLYYDKRYGENVCMPRKCTDNEFIGYIYSDRIYDDLPTCISCDDENRYMSYDCDSCTNRVKIGVFACGLSSCPNGKIIDSNGYCHTCDDTATFNATAEQCGLCDNRELINGICAPKCNGFRDNNKVCYACDEPNRVLAPDCGDCRDTRTMYNGYCELKTCDGFKDTTNKCHACDVNYDVAASAEQCALCPNRTAITTNTGTTYCVVECDGFRGNDGKCYDCDTTDSISAPDCGKCTNRTIYNDGTICSLSCENGFWGDDGKCYDCYDLRNIKASDYLCTYYCPNREGSNGYCRLPECSPYGEFRGSDGKCYNCLDSAKISADSSECAKCAKYDEGHAREMVGDMCVQQECDGFRGNYGRCYACDRTYPEEAPDCGKCTNREMAGGHCVLKCDSGSFYAWHRNVGWGDAQCFDCDTDEFLAVFGAESCNKCSNREMWTDKYCLPKCNGFRDTNGNCHACDEENGVSANDCGNCSNREMYNGYCALKECDGFKDRSGKCYSCDSGNTVYVGSNGETECAKCSDRTFDGYYCLPNTCPTGMFKGNNYCYSCDNESMWVQSTTEECAACNNREMVNGYCRPKCLDGQFRDNNGKCYYCAEESMVQTSAEQCAKCGHSRKMIEDDYYGVQYCALANDGGLTDVDGNWYACDDYNSSWVPVNDCGTCTNRDLYNFYGEYYCLFDKCTNGFRAGDMLNCIPCSEEKSVWVYQDEDCRCSNRELVGGNCALKCQSGQFHEEGGKCYDCSTTENVKTSAERCALCPNREMFGENCILKCPDGQFRDVNGTCQRCDSANEITPLGNNCSQCSNREMYGDVCVKKCENGFRSLPGKCYSCDETEDVLSTSTNCRDCAQREMQSSYCVLKCDNGFKGKDGSCYECSDYRGVEASETECSKCSDRTMDGNYCLKNCDGGFRGYNKNCYSCYDSRSIMSSVSDCTKVCTNRTMDGSYCVIK